MKFVSLLDIRKKAKNKKIVHCHGCFDFLHVGHIRHLEEARNFGELLVVTVTADQFVNKGSYRPIFTAEERCEMLSALECVDFVAINHAATAITALNAIKPEFYIKGTDYTDINCDEFKIATELGARVMFTNTIKYSSTEIIERIRKC